jgi:hypothetical protein
MPLEEVNQNHILKIQKLIKMHLTREDWERESLKDLVYLYEEMELLRIEIMQEQLSRKPANITVKFEDNESTDTNIQKISTDSQ